MNHFCLVSFALFLIGAASSFRFDEGMGGRGHDIFGEAGMNAVPRLGRRSSPYDAFRFRFNGASSNGRGQYEIRKRMTEALGLDKASNAAAASVGGSKSNGKMEPDMSREEENVEEELDAYLSADEYWREYLNDIARRKVIEKLSQVDSSSAFSSPHGGVKHIPIGAGSAIIKGDYSTPMQRFLDSRMLSGNRNRFR
jgi:hypothetical protein